MSDPTTQSEHVSRQTKPWRFSLRKLLLLVTLVAIFCGIACWSLKYALLFVGLAYATWVALFTHRISWLAPLNGLAALAVLLVMILPTLRPARTTAGTGIIAIRVIDAATHKPVANASLTVAPNGNTHHSVSGTTNKQGVCRLAATFSAKHSDAGWGRFALEVFLQNTKLDVSASGYQPTTVDWEDVSPEISRPVDAPPAAPVVVLIEPLPTP